MLTIFFSNDKLQEAQPMLDQIRQYYFGEATISETTMPEYMRMLSYMNFIYGVQKQVVIRAQKSECPQRLQM